MKEQVVGRIEQLTTSLDHLYKKRAEILFDELSKYIKEDSDKQKIISTIEKWMW